MNICVRYYSVTLGLRPGSNKKIWNTLRQERPKSLFIGETNFVDFTESLADFYQIFCRNQEFWKISAKILDFGENFTKCQNSWGGGVPPTLGTLLL